MERDIWMWKCNLDESTISLDHRRFDQLKVFIEIVCCFGVARARVIALQPSLEWKASSFTACLWVIPHSLAKFVFVSSFSSQKSLIVISRESRILNSKRRYHATHPHPIVEWVEVNWSMRIWISCIVFYGVKNLSQRVEKEKEREVVQSFGRSLDLTRPADAIYLWSEMIWKVWVACHCCHFKAPHRSSHREIICYEKARIESVRGSAERGATCFVSIRRFFYVGVKRLKLS